MDSRSLKMLGNNNARRKLDSDKVGYIRSMRWRKHMNMKQLAEKMGVSYSAVQKVIYSERWLQ